MLTSVIIFLPLVTSLFWLHLHVLIANKASTFAAFTCFMVTVSLFIFGDCCYSDSSSPIGLLASVNNLSQFFTPCIIPLLLIYFRRMRTDEEVRVKQFFWVFLPIVLFTTAELLTFLVGKPYVEAFLFDLFTQGRSAVLPDSQKELLLYHNSAVILYRIIIFAEMVILIVSYIMASRKDGYKIKNLWNFFFKDREIDMVGLQYFNVLPLLIICIIKLFLFRGFLNEHQWISMTLSALLAIFLCPFCFTALFGSRKKITTNQMRTAFRYNFSPKDKDLFIEKMLTEMLEEANDNTLLKLYDKYKLKINYLQEHFVDMGTYENDHPFTVRFRKPFNRTYDPDSLTGRLKHLMLEEKLYLQQGLTLEEVAERLYSNKTYISKIVNSDLGVGFPELVNTLRVQYAEDYLINHPNARQEDIAKACGFSSASSFNNIFKKVTGLPPRIWLATHNQNTT